MAEVRRSAPAEADPEAILTDLNAKDPATAERSAEEFRRMAQSLGRFPEIGRSRPEIAPGLRSTLVEPFVLFYRIEDDVVPILRILPGRRDLRRIMTEDNEA